MSEMKEQIDVAAKWWADQLRHGANQDAGDQRINLFTAICVGTGVFNVTTEQADAFEKALSDLLPSHLSKSWNEEDPLVGSAFRHLACDYHAEGPLFEAAKTAGISDSCPPFPMKTVMWIDPDKVAVSCGYRAPTETIWTKENGAELGEPT